jgi:hypothetical protein
MKLDKMMIGMIAGVSLFVGFVIFTVGVGGVFPSIHKLTAPLVCRGEVQVKSVKYSYKPGQVGWTHHVYCDSESGRKEITFLAVSTTGLVASVIVFIILLFRMRKSLTLSENSSTSTPDLNPGRKTASSGTGRTGSALERLTELKKTRDQNLISDAEYERKKTEIMDKL